MPVQYTTDGTTSDNARIIQTVRTTKKDTASNSTGSQSTWEFTGFNVTITPKVANHGILITGFVNIAVTGGGQNIVLGIRKSSNNVTAAMGDSSGSRRVEHSGQFTAGDHGTCSCPVSFIDYPNSTSAQTYYVQISHGSSATRTIYVNRTVSDSNNAERARCVSTLVAQEIAS